MTEIHKAVLKVCEIAETADEWSYQQNAVNLDYELTDEDKWKEYVLSQLIHAMLQYGKPYYGCNKRAIQEAVQFKVQFKTIQLHDATIVTAIASWVEKNYQTDSLYLQTACCSKVFGNTY